MRTAADCVSIYELVAGAGFVGDGERSATPLAAQPVSKITTTPKAITVAEAMPAESSMGSLRFTFLASGVKNRCRAPKRFSISFRFRRSRILQRLKSVENI